MAIGKAITELGDALANTVKKTFESNTVKTLLRKLEKL